MTRSFLRVFPGIFSGTLSLAAIVGIAFLACAAANPASAQDTKAQDAKKEEVPKLEPAPIAVIDFRGVLSSSNAVKGIRTQVDTRRSEYREKFAVIEKDLREKQESLVQQRRLITKDAFEKRSRELKEEARQAQLKAQAHNQQIKAAFDSAMEQVQEKLFKVVAEVAEDTGASVVLFRSAIVIAVKKLEISHLALERLNEALPEVKVVFVSEEN